MRFSLLLLLTLFSSLAFAGGFIIVNPSDIQQDPDRWPPRVDDRVNIFPLNVVSNQIEVDITNELATTSVEQVFYNPTNARLEGYFLFPVPKGVVINDFQMTVNGKMTGAELLDADKARSIYEEIVRRTKDPALLEYYTNDVFRVRIFPIEPRSEQRIKLSYSESLVKDNGTVEYVFPLNTEKFSAKPLNQVSFRVDIESSFDIKNVFCPTHETEINLKGKRDATVGFEAQNTKSDHDFKLYFSTDSDKVGASLLTYNDALEDGYFFLNLSPGFTEQNEIAAKDITFVLDASGSMSGEKMEQAQEALKFCVNNLNANDRFNIVRFSTEATSLFTSTERATTQNILKARSYIDGLKAIGGTNIEEALELALDPSNQTEGRPYFVVFMTDGKPTIGETQIDALLKDVEDANSSNTRIFTFGIGVDLNTHLLDKITEMTGAYRTYVLPDEDIEIKVSEFYGKVSSPVKITFDKSLDVSDIYEKELPDLFKGSSVGVFGRYAGSGSGTVKLEGKLNGKTETFTYELDFEKKNTEHDFIPGLWGSRAVGYLLDQIRLNGSNQELVGEVVRLAKKHGIITPYTSYLIIEDEEQMLTQRPLGIPMPEPLLRNRVQDDFGFMEESEANFDKGFNTTEGLASVRASSEAQQLNKSANVATNDFKREKSLEYKDAGGQIRNLADEIVTRNGRAMYNSDQGWVDANTQEFAGEKVNMIEFNSKAYFDLLNSDEEAHEFLALGRNVKFVLNGKVYQIH